MTWGEFKKRAEELGVQDADRIGIEAIDDEGYAIFVGTPRTQHGSLGLALLGEGQSKMSAKPLLIDGVVEDIEASGTEREERQRLEAELRQVRRDLEDRTAEVRQLARTIENLRTMLGPLHRALRAVFGEIDLAVGLEAQEQPKAGQGPAPTIDEARWQNYKNSFPGASAEIIEALQIHGEMRMFNLAGLLKRDVRTIRKAEAKLRAAGATSLTGGVVSLRR